MLEATRSLDVVVVGVGDTATCIRDVSTSFGDVGQALEELSYYMEVT